MSKKNILLIIFSIILIFVSVGLLIIISLNYEKPTLNSENDKVENISYEIYSLDFYYVGAEDDYLENSYLIKNSKEVVQINIAEKLGGPTYDYKIMIYQDGKDVSNEFLFENLSLTFEYGYNWIVYVFEIMIGPDSVIMSELPRLGEYYKFSNGVLDAQEYVLFVQTYYPLDYEELEYQRNIYGEDYFWNKYINNGFNNLFINTNNQQIIDWWDSHPEYFEWREIYEIDKNYGGA